MPFFETVRFRLSKCARRSADAGKNSKRRGYRQDDAQDARLFAVDIDVRKPGTDLVSRCFQKCGAVVAGLVNGEPFRPVMLGSRSVLPSRSPLQ